MKAIGWIVVVWSTLLTSAYAASFDCAMAKAKIEKRICEDDQLSKLDEELASVYKKTLEQRGNTEFIKEKQGLWLKERNGCQDLECLRFSYESRISELVATYSIYGQYVNYKLICEVRPPDCHTMSDSLKISKGRVDKLTHVQDIKVEANFVFANLHSCNFEGEGMLVNDRVLVANKTSGCKLVLIYSQDEIHTVVITPEQCRTHCGMRGNLDEIVVRKSMSASKSH